MSVLAYTPEDMTVSVTADTTLAALQHQLGARGQWLPVDPPNPDRVTVGETISFNLSGPRRYGYGTIREHLIGIRVELADGRLIKAGGNVVKNVAGYDLCKLFTGARGELGTVREANFKVRPLPETEQFVHARFPTVEAACEFVEEVDGSRLTPVVMDLHNGFGHVEAASAPRSAGTQPGSAGSGLFPTPPASAGWTVVIGFAGDRETVEWQRREAEHFAALADTDLGYEQRFWAAADAGLVRKIAVLPSRLAEAIRALAPAPRSLVARAGNGIIHYRGGPKPPKPELPLELMQRLRDAFDPSHKLNRPAA